MTSNTERTRKVVSADNWERYGWAWGALFYAVLLIPALIATRDPDNSAHIGRIWLFVAALTVLQTGNIIAYTRLDDYRNYPALGLAYCALAYYFWFSLVRIDAVFYLVLFGLYGQIYSILKIRWAIPAGIVLTVLMGLSQVPPDAPIGSWRSPSVWITVLAAVSGMLLALWIYSIIEQSAERRLLIEQLQQTQAELAAVERSAGILEERQRLAREIHDTLAQGFTSIIMHLEAADQALPSDTATLSKHLAFARDTARDSLAQARRVVSDLRPIPLDDSSLAEAITRMTTRWSAESGIQAHVNLTGDVVNLHPEIDVTLLRAAQEALANVRKHAHASEATVTLSYLGDVVILDVQDNGAGLRDPSPNGHLSGGYGLQAMRERVAQFSGRVLLESDPGEGTTLVVEIPIG